VIATIATLAALLLPALSNTKVKAHQATCLSNLRQLGIAWTLYKDENLDLLVESYPVNNPSAWVQGNMTNSAEAVDLGLLRDGKLYQYSQNVHIYHCPTDPGVTIGGTQVPSVRSYSMNAFMGHRPAGLPPIPARSSDYVQSFARGADLPSPAKLFVFIDEDERSISDGFFISDPTGGVWYDFPSVSANRHRYAASIMHADGSGNVWRFRDPRTIQVSGPGTDQYTNLDLAFLAEAATVHK